jgi:hypothetical protein
MLTRIDRRNRGLTCQLLFAAALSACANSHAAPVYRCGSQHAVFVSDERWAAAHRCTRWVAKAPLPTGSPHDASGQARPRAGQAGAPAQSAPAHDVQVSAAAQRERDQVRRQMLLAEQDQERQRLHGLDRQLRIAQPATSALRTVSVESLSAARARTQVSLAALAREIDRTPRP